MVIGDGVPEVSASDGRSLVQSGAMLLDVREVDEWDLGHAPEAVLVPLGRLADALALVEPAQPVVVICRSGSRSRAAAAALRGAGIDARNLTGGMFAWLESGGTAVNADGLPGVVF